MRGGSGISLLYFSAEGPGCASSCFFFVRVVVWWIMRRGYFYLLPSTFYFLITVGKGRDELDSVEEELDV